MIKGTASSISPVITRIFNQSLSLGRPPLEWKVSNITPIFKSGDPSLVSNYRPISLLSILSKCLERFIHNAVFNYTMNILFYQTISLVFDLVVLLRTLYCVSLMIGLYKLIGGSLLLLSFLIYLRPFTVFLTHVCCTIYIKLESLGPSTNGSLIIFLKGLFLMVNPPLSKMQALKFPRVLSSVLYYSLSS